MNKQSFYIESRGEFYDKPEELYEYLEEHDGERESFLSHPWSTDYIGSFNSFDTVEEAEETIEHLWNAEGWRSDFRIIDGNDGDEFYYYYSFINPLTVKNMKK